MVQPSTRVGVVEHHLDRLSPPIGGYTVGIEKRRDGWRVSLVGSVSSRCWEQSSAEAVAARDIEVGQVSPCWTN